MTQAYASIQNLQQTTAEFFGEKKSSDFEFRGIWGIHNARKLEMHKGVMLCGIPLLGGKAGEMSGLVYNRSNLP